MKNKNKDTMYNSIVSGLKHLFAENEDINKLDEKGFSPLHNAVLKSDLPKMSELLKGGADINLPDRDGFSPLDHAFLVHYFLAADFLPMLFLLDKGASLEKCKLPKEKFMNKAIQDGNISLVKALVENGIDPSHSHADFSPLALAVSLENPLLVKTLLDNGANPEESGQEFGLPIFAAIESGNIEILNLLINHGANVNVFNEQQNMTPLLFACTFNDIEAAEILLDNGALPNNDALKTTSPLMVAIAKADYEMFDLLLRHGANPNFATEEDVTPLILSWHLKDTKFGEALIKYGAVKSDEDHPIYLDFLICQNPDKLSSIKPEAHLLNVNFGKIKDYIEVECPENMEYFDNFFSLISNEILEKMEL